MQKAYAQMDALEGGAIANPDEKRMVGHYWLRDPERAPTPELRDEIARTVARIKEFAHDVHTSKVRGEKGHFLNLLVIGIGGSALGPQFVADALGSAADRLKPHFFDNTDPEGMDRVFERLGSRLGTTLTLVISKSGGTPETRNGMLEAAAAYQRLGLPFGAHAAAVTQEGSRLDEYAVANTFLARFPMWDWIGGRTSELSAVGLLPAALQGIDVTAMLEGAAAMDRLTRVAEVRKNPAALLAMAWHAAGEGRGAKDMVILPYKDRLALFSRYLQQLVMESLGKERDLAGNVVHQGIAVYGNKGTTDQHAYVQQLREGVPNFFATFIAVSKDRAGASLEVESGVTAGDYLHGLREGTRRALYENGRASITITVPEVSPRTIGMLIALYERAVGFYATLVNVNAYHQPGVEAGKKAAAAVLDVQRKIVSALQAQGAAGATVDQLASVAGGDDEIAFRVLEHLAANPGRGVSKMPGTTPFDAVYRWVR
jgi:glucose-6-phosphate isomerase